jgi:hypothetical protein
MLILLPQSPPNKKGEREYTLTWDSRPVARVAITGKSVWNLAIKTRLCTRAADIATLQTDQVFVRKTSTKNWGVHRIQVIDLGLSERSSSNWTENRPLSVRYK